MRCWRAPDLRTALATGREVEGRGRQERREKGLELLHRGVPARDDEQHVAEGAHLRHAEARWAAGSTLRSRYLAPTTPN